MKANVRFFQQIIVLEDENTWSNGYIKGTKDELFLIKFEVNYFKI